MFIKKSKPIVKFRQEKNYFLAYFIELRKTIPLNYLGSEIVNLFFNKQYVPSKIKEILSTSKKHSNTLETKEINLFLRDLKKELLSPHDGGYPLIGRKQLDIPIAVELQTNTKCNLRCKHCCQGNYDIVMPIKQIKNILNILYKKNIFEINLTGGEIFLHPHVFEIIKLCCEKYNFATIIITNATLLNNSLIRKLTKFKNNLAFLVSLEGVGEFNDAIRGRGVFQRVDKAIKELIKNNIHVEISSTINNLNIDHYQLLINYSRKLKVPLNFNLFKPFKKENHQSLILDPQRYFKFIEDIFRQRKLYGANIGLTNAAIVAEIFGGLKRDVCRATLSGLSINVIGRMPPCPFLGEIGFYSEKQLPQFDENFLENWKNNFYFKKFRENNLRECQACAYLFSGDIKKQDPYGVNAFLKYKKNRQRVVNK